MLLVLEGIDGSGKSTIASLIHRKLKARVQTVTQYHKLSTAFDHPYLETKMSKLREILAIPASEQRYLSMFGERYWLFLLAAWFSALQKNRIEPAKSPRSLTIIDGWYYRFLAKFMYKGTFDREWLFSLFNTVDEPDLVVMLDVDPQIAWRRRPTYKPSEIGVYEVKKEQATRDDFQIYCAYQSALRQTLLEFAEEMSWLVVHQTERSTEEETGNYICDHVLEYFPDV